MLVERNCWIIVPFYPREYSSLDMAREKLAELKAAAPPGRKFAMYRIKRAGHEPGCPRNRALGIMCECPQGLYEAQQADAMAGA
jgi:hypothetical protein